MSWQRMGGGAIVNFKSFMADSVEANWKNVRNYMGMMTHLSLWRIASTHIHFIILPI
jgi:hypothetical protein